MSSFLNDRGYWKAGRFIAEAVVHREVSFVSSQPAEVGPHAPFDSGGEMVTYREQSVQ